MFAPYPSGKEEGLMGALEKVFLPFWKRLPRRAWIPLSLGGVSMEVDMFSALRDDTQIRE